MSVGQMLSNLFGGAQNPQAQQQPQAQPQPTPPGNIPVQQTAAMQSDPNNINVPAQTTQAQVEGLDKFTDLWKPAESPSGQQPSQLFNVDPKQLMEAASKVDFSKAINPNHLQAISAGGEDAMKALSQVLNQVSQTVYAQNAMTTTKIVEQAVKQTRDSIMADLPQHIKLQAASDSLRNDNPALNHPSAAPIIGALQQQLAVKFPNASATELATMAKNYLTDFASVAAPRPTQTQEQSSSKETDWSAYLS